MYPAETVKGQKFYPVGVGRWIWEEEFQEAS